MCLCFCSSPPAPVVCIHFASARRIELQTFNSIARNSTRLLTSNFLPTSCARPAKVAQRNTFACRRLTGHRLTQPAFAIRRACQLCVGRTRLACLLRPRRKLNLKFPKRNTSSTPLTCFCHFPWRDSFPFWLGKPNKRKIISPIARITQIQAAAAAAANQSHKNRPLVRHFEGPRKWVNLCVGQPAS